MHFYGIIKKRKSGDSMTEEIKIIDFLTENQLDAIFVQKDENCRYLSKFTGSDSYLFLPNDFRNPPRYNRQLLFLPAPYICCLSEGIIPLSSETNSCRNL